jgi:hypothetical protein
LHFCAAVLLFSACVSPAAVHVACVRHHVRLYAFKLLVQQHQQGFGGEAPQQQLQGTCTLWPSAVVLGAARPSAVRIGAAVLVLLLMPVY